MDIGFERLKREVEADIGRPVDQAEEIELKALYYFGRGIKLKTRLESEPERLGDICERVLEDVGDRMERCEKQQHQARVISATRDLVSHKSSGPKKSRQRIRGKLLF